MPSQELINKLNKRAAEMALEYSGSPEGFVEIVMLEGAKITLAFLRQVLSDLAETP